MLLALPNDELLVVATQLLSLDVPSVLRLRQACKALHSKLQPIEEAVQRRRLRWVLQHTRTLVISEDECSLTVCAPRSDDHWVPHSHDHWGSGSLLPTAGTSAWKVRVQGDDFDFESVLEIGVTDALAVHAWGLDLAS